MTKNNSQCFCQKSTNFHINAKENEILSLEILVKMYCYCTQYFHIYKIVFFVQTGFCLMYHTIRNTLGLSPLQNNHF